MTDMLKSMTTTSNMKFLPYNLPYMTEELEKRAKSELFEDDDSRVRSLKLLKTMLREEKNLNFLDEDKFLLMFLRARKFDVKRSFHLVKRFYTVKQKHDELFENLDINIIKRTMKENSIGYLPYRDEEGCVILIIKIGNWNPNINNMGDIMRITTAGLVLSCDSPSTQVAGFKVIVDCEGLNFSYLPHVRAKYLWLFAEALQNCFPARFRAIHIYNENHLFTYVWTVLRQFLTKKLKDRFHFHGKNPKKLHNYFSPSILPKEFGGELPAFDNSEWANQMVQFMPRIEYLNSFGCINKQKS